MKKGFTLIELMGVLIILATLTLIVSTIVINEINNTKRGLSENAKQIIISSAKDYVNNHDDLFSTSGDKVYCITFQTLLDSGSLTSGMIPKDESSETLKTQLVEVKFNGIIFEYNLVTTCTPK